MGFNSGFKVLSTKNVVGYWVLTIHEWNAPFPVTRHQFRMMCDKDILQLYFEYLNCAMPPLEISYHHTISVTVSCSNRHQVCAGCLLSRQILLGHLDPWKWDWLVIPKCQNGITTLCCVKSKKRAGPKTCSISACLLSGKCQMVEYICVVRNCFRKCL